ncbi:Sec34-like family-domain-containing protein [Cokeromyces recurvatus]|uniref:Sec34-like family-domain-containing protein n=1 Tax=Cokeromyces recurvatus TaxID=90255 RepID=UPI00221EB187|nr:Sec34-like family-domain-containing protein [Cokeromyces recurvatus]KAI7904190.1 Sec34-like family-domain-containing protein [Cokeromyces recurvatus]
MRGTLLEEWEEKTKLTEKEQQSIYDLQEACTELPLPSNWYLSDKLSSSPYATSSGALTPVPFTASPPNPHLLSTQLLSRTLSSTSLVEFRQQVAQTINAPKPIETLQEFFDWFAMIENEMQKGQEDVYRNHLSIVRIYKESTEALLKSLEETNGLFDELEHHYSFVEMRTRLVQTACESLLEDQDRLTELADELRERLSYFNELEPIAKLLNSPGEDICLDKQFTPMLGKLDECIEYMKKHQDYRDSELYLMRFRQCLTRGISLIKMYVVSTIKKLGYDVYKQANAKDNLGNKQATMYYVKFRTIAFTIKSLTAEVEKRCLNNKEYQALYEDMVYAYVQTRQQLLSPLISKKIQQLGPNDGDILELAKNGCAYMMSLCSDEYNLFYNFFQKTGEKDLYKYLDLLTSYLYDYLRPRIIHENDISTLSELCNLFLMYVMQDENDFAIGVTEDKDEVKFGHLIQNILEDAQARLVFRAQMFIYNDIQNYQAKPEDFEMSQNNATHLQGNDKKKSSVVLDTNAAALLEVTAEEDSVSIRSSITDNNEDIVRGGYPTLQKTLWVLSKLYRCIQTSVFQDLAQEAVSLCNTSLQKASDTLSTLKSVLDGQLFLIKNLLVLKEQLAPFEASLVHAGKALDFSHVTNSFSSFQQQRALLFNPNALIGLAQRGMPRVVEINVDSRREIDLQIKRVCEAFIHNCVSSCVEPLTTFLIKLSTILPPEALPTSLVDSSTQQLKGKEVQESVQQFMEATEERMKYMTRKLREYINDEKMEHILIKPVQTNIIEQYKSFLIRIEIELKEGGRIEKMEEKPMSPESMVVWITTVIKDQ